jgi:hypothetical protein
MHLPSIRFHSWSLMISYTHYIFKWSKDLVEKEVNVKAENANIALVIVRFSNAEICYFFIKIGLI